MMKTARLFAVALAGIALLGSSALAQQADEPKPKRQRLRARRNDLRNLYEKNLYERLVAELNLTAEQQGQVRQILETHRQAVENWRKENAEDIKVIRQQIRQARGEKDAEKLKQLQKKLAALMKQRRDLQQAMHKQIASVLTDKQKEKFENLLRAGRRVTIGLPEILAAMRRLGLSEDQKKQVRKMFDAAKKAAAKARTPKEKAALWQRLIKDIKDDVLTKEQAKKFEQALRRMRLRRRVRTGIGALNLTNEQREKINKIRAEYREKIRKADREDRLELMKEMREKINAVLTDEQKAELKKQRDKPRGPLGSLDLTDAQEKKINEIRAEYREKIRNADREDRLELMKEMREKINAVLTDEQKAELKKQRRERMRNRRQGRRQRRRGRPESSEDD